MESLRKRKSKAFGQEELVRVRFSRSKGPKGLGGGSAFFEGAFWVPLQGPTPESPELWVRKDAYESLRREAAEELLQRTLQGLGGAISQEVLQGLSPRIEKRIYEMLVSREGRSTRGAVCPGRQVFSFYRARLMDGVLSHIEGKRLRAAERLQEIWKKLLGETLARESFLLRVEPANGVAYVRCCDGALALEITRRGDLARRLSEELGVPVRRLRVVW